jgi:putative ABC transport system permease protein
MVATISLVVGGIGIMNIMLVSVTERTREIGLRKALGATNKNILTQFLLEATILTGIGGLVGIAFGSGLSFATALIISNVFGLAWSFTFPWQAAILGIMVSGAVGLIFGIYPARKAAAKSPIEALRYE